VSGSEIRWAKCKSAPCSRQITTPAPHRSVFTGRMPFLLPNQQCQSSDGKKGGGLILRMQKCLHAQYTWQTWKPCKHIYQLCRDLKTGTTITHRNADFRCWAISLVINYNFRKYCHQVWWSWYKAFSSNYRLCWYENIQKTTGPQIWSNYLQ